MARLVLPISLALLHVDNAVASVDMDTLLLTPSKLRSEARSIKLYVYELPGDLMPLSLATKPDSPFYFERPFGEHITQSSFRTRNPEEADAFYVPVAAVNFYLQNRDASRICRSKCDAVEGQVLEHMRAVGPYWDSRQKDHIVPSLRCPGWLPSAPQASAFKKLWQGEALQLCSEATGDSINRRALHTGYFVGPGQSLFGTSDGTSLVAVPLGIPSTTRDLLAVYAGSMIPKTPANWYRERVAKALQECTDCQALILESHGPPPPAGHEFWQKLRAALGRAAFQIVPPGDVLDRPSREQSLFFGTVPVVFERVKGMGSTHLPWSDLLDWSKFSVTWSLTPEEESGGRPFWPRLEAHLRSLVRSGKAARLQEAGEAVRARFRYDDDGVVTNIAETLALRRLGPTPPPAAFLQARVATSGSLCRARISRKRLEELQPKPTPLHEISAEVLHGLLLRD